MDTNVQVFLNSALVGAPTLFSQVPELVHPLWVGEGGGGGEGRRRLFPPPYGIYVSLHFPSYSRTEL